MKCKFCDHSCHCRSDGKCQLPHCDCLKCEHNALDDFWERNNGKETKSHPDG